MFIWRDDTYNIATENGKNVMHIRLRADAVLFMLKGELRPI